MEIDLEIRQLKDENQALKCRYKEADVARAKAETFAEELQARIEVLESNIQFLKGQIEAYQFCINNRR